MTHKTDNEYFIITVWPVRLDRVDDIKKMISKDYNIKKDMELKFDISWEEMVRSVYADDRVKERNLVAKIKVYSKFPKIIHLIYIDVLKPAYRVKTSGRKLSTAMERLKKKIRGSYGSKKSHSKNPIHIVDEYDHSINYDKFLERFS